MQDRWNGIGSFSVHRRRLAFERMEERRLLSVGPLAPDATFASVSSDLASLTGTVDGYPVSIDRHDAPAQSIDELERAWLVIHGNASAPTASYINVLADALHSASSGDQVLTLDWSTIAALAIGTTENYIIRVAEWASSTLTSYGFSGGLLNLVGHSFGAYVAGEMAERIPGGVNTIVGLDPAENWPFGYNPESSGQIDFAGFSAFSWTFSDAGGFYGSEVTPGSAHEAVTVENTDHSGPVRLFSNMLKGVGSADVLHYLPISRLLDHTAGPWAPNQYDHSGNPTASGAFEAVITADAAGDAALSIDFVALASDDPPTADAGGPYLVDEGST
ncbi:MAG: hypothetical protein HQ582_26135, partial [Planctomycetes bacterium]|nr:hypothetical protein [Planctomycetota bacterium]